MKARWWQGGLHIDPETPEDDAIIMGLMNFLKVVRVEDRVEVSPVTIVETNDQEPVVVVQDAVDKQVE